MSWPVIHLESSERRKFRRDEMSSVLPILLSGLLFLIRSWDVSFFNRRSDILLLKRDGEIQFNLNFGANSAAKDLHKPTKADFDIEIDE